MAHPLSFPGVVVLPSRPRPYHRPLGDKLHEIAIRSPKDIRAFDVIADLVLSRLDDEDRKRS